jgi:hypothetical protein
VASINDLLERIWRGLHIPQDDARGLFTRTTPAIIIDDLTRPPGTDPTVTRPFMGNVYVSANAANESSIQIVNPARSGRLAILTGIAPGSGGDNRLYGLAGALAAVGGTLNDAGVAAQYIQSTDLRDLTLPAVTIHGSNTAGAVVQLAAASYNVFLDSATRGAVIPLNVVLRAGQAMSFTASNQNVTLYGTFFGVEIPDLAGL